uniref:Uncharacterized protein n=1 Tax=Tanacetum cinerariifolium TaxID=118510 RepID=A0A699GT09_TANCI|nr:hypothetical protein [Tanacetum cinerariifolium]
MRRVGKGCSGVETPLFENMLQVREEDAEEEVQVSAYDHVDQENVIEEIDDDVAPPTSPLPSSPIQVLEKCSALVHRVEGLESANTAQQLEILKLKARVKKLEKLNKVKSSKLMRLKKVGTSQRIESSEDEENVFNQGRISVDIDEGIELVDDQEKDEDSEVQEVVEVMNAAKLITEVVAAATTQFIPAVKPVVAAVSTPISAVKPKVLKVVPAAPTFSTRKRKGVIIRDPEEELHDDTLAETQSAKDKRQRYEEEESLAQAKDAQVTDVQPKDAPAKRIQYIRRYHGYKKKPQSESKTRKNMIAYLKNTKGFKMAFFKGKTYDQIRLIFHARFDANMRFLLKSKEEMEKEEEEIIKSINETPGQKAAKRRRLREQAKEAKDLKKQLEVVADEDDDVFVEATPISTKVPVVNYNTPCFWVIDDFNKVTMYLLYFTRLL